MNCNAKNRSLEEIGFGTRNICVRKLLPREAAHRMYELVRPFSSFLSIINFGTQTPMISLLRLGTDGLEFFSSVSVFGFIAT